MKKPLFNTTTTIGLVCAVFICGGIFLSSSTPTALDLSQSQDTNKSESLMLEKTVSPQNITALLNTPDLTAEQAAIFYANLPQSLADSPLPSALDTNEQGELIINMKVRRLFEFYLSAIGEETLAECILRIRHALTQQLPESAIATGLEVLEGFLQYQNHIGEIKNNFSARYHDDTYDLERIKEIKQTVRASRSLFLSPQTSLAFYKQEDEYDDYMINKMAIKSRTDLTAQQKQVEYEYLNHQSPAWISQQELHTNLINHVQAQEKTLRESHADESAIHQLRVKHYGEQGAQNLAALDQQRAQWANRVEQYRLESQAIITSSGYSQAEKEQLLQGIREQHFSGSELIRIKALDNMAGKSVSQLQ